MKVIYCQGENKDIEAGWEVLKPRDVINLNNFQFSKNLFSTVM